LWRGNAEKLEFLRAHWDVLAAAGFFTVEVWTALGLVRYHAFFRKFPLTVLQFLGNNARR
jgi:hypothetical protein